MSKAMDKVEDMLLDLGFTRIKITPARGYWTHMHQDCMRWTGWAIKNGTEVELGSWDTLTLCAKRGIEVTPGDQAGGYADWDVSAKGKHAKK